MAHRTFTLAWLLLAGTPGWSAAGEIDANGVPVPMPVSAISGFHDLSLIEDLSGRWSGAGAWSPC